jgi:hypothetical protein
LIRFVLALTILKKLFLIFLLTLLLYGNSAFSATIAWTGGTSSNWNTATNWSGGAVPNTGDIVNIGTGTNFTNQPTISAAPAKIPSIINIGNSKAVTLTISSGFTLTVGAINMSATTKNSVINVDGTLAVTGNIILGAAASNTRNKLVLGANGSLILGGTVTGGTLDCGTGTGSIQLNGAVAQTFPATTTTTTFLNDINLLRISNLVGVTLSSTFASLSNDVGELIIDNSCTFDANAQLSPSASYFATVGVNSVYISKGNFVQNANDVFDATATIQFTATTQVITLAATATAGNACPNVTLTGTNITINGNATNTTFKIRGNLSVTTSTSVTYNTISAIDISGNFTGTNSLLSAALPISIGGSWTNTATGTIAGAVTYNGTSGTQTVATNVTYGNNLTFTNAATKQIAPGTLNFQGTTFDNSSGSYLDCVTNTTTVNMNGAVDQTISGGTATDANIATDVVTGTTFYNLTIANTGATTPTVTLAGNNNIAPSGVLKISTTNNTLDATAANSLTLMSTGIGTATVADITNAGTTTGTSITGTVNAQRFVTGGALKYRGYRFFSAPVHMNAIAQALGLAGSGNVYNLKYLNTATTTYPITTGSAAGGFDKTGNPTIYLYREDRNANNSVFSGGNYIGISNITGTTLSYNTTNNTTTSGYLPVGNGFAFFFRGSKALLAGRTTLPISSATNYPDNNTVTDAGTLNQGNVSVILWYNTTTANNYQTTLSYTVANTTSTGFNLVGNPYASSIDWSKFSATVSTAAIYGPNLNPTVYELDPATNIFGTYNAVTLATTFNGNNIISSGQGFFVKAASAGASLKFTEQAKSNTQLASGSTLLLAATAQPTTYNQYIRLNLAKDTTGRSEILVGFNPTSTKNYNEIEDDLFMYPLTTTNQSMWVMSNDKVKLVTKWRGLPKAKQQDTINISVIGKTSGQFTLTRAELKGIPTLYKVWLMDGYMKDSLDLRNNSTYVFNINLADTNTFGSHRFQIIVREDPALGVRLLNFTATKATTGAQTIWKTENEDHYTNFVIERSNDNGLTYKVLDSLISGDSGTYDFIDKNPLSINLYRLKMVDLDGVVTYSNAVTLSYSTLSNNIVNNSINVYPNPSTGIINLAINTGISAPSSSNATGLKTTGFANSFSTLSAVIQKYGIKILSITGVVVKTTTSSSANWQDNVSSLAPGTYIIQVVNNSDQSLVGKSTFIKI